MADNQGLQGQFSDLSNVIWEEIDRISMWHEPDPRNTESSTDDGHNESRDDHDWQKTRVKGENKSEFLFTTMMGENGLECGYECFISNLAVSWVDPNQSEKKGWYVL